MSNLVNQLTAAGVSAGIGSVDLAAQFNREQTTGKVVQYAEWAGVYHSAITYKAPYYYRHDELSPYFYRSVDMANWEVLCAFVPTSGSYHPSILTHSLAVSDDHQQIAIGTSSQKIIISTDGGLSFSNHSPNLTTSTDIVYIDGKFLMHQLYNSVWYYKNSLSDPTWQEYTFTGVPFGVLSAKQYPNGDIVVMGASGSTQVGFGTTLSNLTDRSFSVAIMWSEYNYLTRTLYTNNNSTGAYIYRFETSELIKQVGIASYNGTSSFGIFADGALWITSTPSVQFIDRNGVAYKIPTPTVTNIPTTVTLSEDYAFIMNDYNPQGYVMLHAKQTPVVVTK